MNTKKVLGIIASVASAIAFGSAAFVLKHNKDARKALTTGEKK